MTLNNSGKENETSYLDLFKEFHLEIQSIFRSTLGVRVLVSLNEGPASLVDLSKKTGSSVQTLFNKNTDLISEGLVERVLNEYALTNSARIITPQIIDFIAVVRTLTGEANGVSDRDQKDDLRETWATVQRLYRSWIIDGCLLALSEGDKTRSQIRDVSGCTSQALATQIRWLKGKGLMKEKGYEYSLTPVGKTVAEGMEQFTATFAAVMRHREFWNSHNLTHLPEFAFLSLGDLVGAEIIRDTPTNYLVNFEHYKNLLAEAKFIHGISNMANPSIADAIGARAIAGVPSELIVSPEIAYSLQQEPYREKVAALMSTPIQMQFRVTEEPIPMGLTVTDKGLSSKLFLRDGMTFDMQNGLFCTAPKARAWGERVIEYYRIHSVPMEEYIQSSESN